MSEVERVMPNRIHLGKSYSGTMGAAMHRYSSWKDEGSNPDPYGRSMVMGFVLPTWQRPFVWTREQQIRFLESIWLGLYLGTYTFNTADIDGPYDGLLIDGQQRMWTVQEYLEDELPVFGYRWSQITDADRREFKMSRTFGYYETNSTDEQYLRDYYNMMNFGGTPHTEDQRA